MNTLKNLLNLFRVLLFSTSSLQFIFPDGSSPTSKRFNIPSGFFLHAPASTGTGTQVSQEQNIAQSAQHNIASIAQIGEGDTVVRLNNIFLSSDFSEAFFLIKEWRDLALFLKNSTNPSDSKFASISSRFNSFNKSQKQVASIGQPCIASNNQERTNSIIHNNIFFYASLLVGSCFLVSLFFKIAVPMQALGEKEEP